MSYAPIYSKLHELEERLRTVESSKSVASVVPTTVPSASSASDFDCSAMRKEIDDILKVVSTLATKAELPDVSAFATFATKAELPDVSEFATKAELPDVSEFAAFATKAELPDVSVFATKAELPDVSVFATKAELPDVSEFATKAELPDVSGIAILSEKFDNLINVVSQLNIKINEANDKIAVLESA
jgi:hypothetical protein